MIPPLGTNCVENRNVLKSMLQLYGLNRKDTVRKKRVNKMRKRMTKLLQHVSSNDIHEFRKIISIIVITRSFTNTQHIDFLNASIAICDSV